MNKKDIEEIKRIFCEKIEVNTNIAGTIIFEHFCEGKDLNEAKEKIEDLFWENERLWSIRNQLLELKNKKARK